MSYHVSPDLTPDQVRLLKMRAAAERTTVKELVTIQLQLYLEKWSDNSDVGKGSRGKPAKQKQN